MEISYDNGNKKFHAGNLVVNPNVEIKITGKCHKPVNGNTKFFPVSRDESALYRQLAEAT